MKAWLAKRPRFNMQGLASLPVILDTLVFQHHLLTDKQLNEAVVITRSTSNTASDVWADSAYRSDEIEETLAERGLKSRIHRRAYRNRKLSEAQKAANTTRSKVRARVEHVFGDQKNGMGAELVRTIGIVRARCKIGSDEPCLQHAPLRLS